ncbi:hypothetical protein ACFOGI_12990 [Virgibacillus xinjiangensis]|uniref:DUF3311 domain-containing protein n=1 Tax=Virgibacillus xinjiangensis TaxID=393090 RepID=A0ABV7CXQ9_9BACI
MKGKKEPIRYWKIWVVLFILLSLSVPWYLPAGTYEPLILGVPYWAYIIMGVSLLISITLTYVLDRYWQMTDEEEEDEEWKI